MLRPIDTQLIYQQSNEISNRQQAAKQEVEMQQTQFSNILQKETAQKQESVVEIKHDEQIKNELNKKNEHQQSQEMRKYKKKKEKNGDIESKECEDHAQHIDIRI